MLLEEGKKYVDRRGRVFGPMMRFGKYFGEGLWQNIWNEDGSMWHGSKVSVVRMQSNVE